MTSLKRSIPWNKGKKGLQIAWNKNSNISIAGKRFHYIWSKMLQRCRNLKDPEYFRYGGRGILVCKKWSKFNGFFEDMFNSYNDKLTIDRIDNDGNYSRNNCKWSTKREQARNTRNTERAKRFKYMGKIQTVREWAEEFGIKRQTLHMRLSNYKMSIGQALNFSNL